MNIQPRSLALVIGFVISTIALGACNDDTSKPVGDVLAQDSSLNLAVFSATGDTATPGTDQSVAMMTTPTTVQSSPAPAQQTAAAPIAARPRATTTPTSVNSTRVSRTRNARSGSVNKARTRRSARLTSNRSVSSVESPIRRTRSRRASHVGATQPVQVAAEPETSPGNTVTYTPRVPRASAAVIPVGSSLSLVTNAQICTSSARVGDRFSARLVKDLVAPSGLVIPAGTIATGEIVSLPGNDSRMRVGIQSIDFDGRSYPVGSQVSYTDVQRMKVQSSGGSVSRVVAGAGIGAILGRVIGGNARSTIAGAAAGAAGGAVLASRSVRYDQCVPSGGQIIAHLTQPLRVNVGE
ncbi:MAG: hypothetical protein ABIZ36_03820 [Gemmatimonadaceae bacterium]